MLGTSYYSSILFSIFTALIHGKNTENQDHLVWGNDTEEINITYVYTNQPPYESITDNMWQFECCGNDPKKLNGIMSRILYYITRKHCPHFKFNPHRVESLQELMNLLKTKNSSAFNELGIAGKHFIFSPIPMSPLLYYTMHYNPRTFTWKAGFVKSPGIAVIHRLSDVDISQRIFHAVSESSAIIGLIAWLVPIVGLSTWLLDRKWNEKPSTSPLLGIFDKMYLSIVTLATVGYGDIVPVTLLGKLISIVWMCISTLFMACMVSVMTSDMLAAEDDLSNQTVALVNKTWDQLLGRLLVNHYRSINNTLGFLTYLDMLEAVQKNEGLYAGLADYNVLAMMQSELKDRDLGKRVYSNIY